MPARERSQHLDPRAVSSRSAARSAASSRSSRRTPPGPPRGDDPTQHPALRCHHPLTSPPRPNPRVVEAEDSRTHEIESAVSPSVSQEVRPVSEHVAFVVNGTPRELDVEPRRLLVHYLREDLGLTGTHVGCDTSQCGACTVLRRRPGGQVVHDARRPGRRRRDHHHRGPRARRAAAPDAGRPSGKARPPVRLLHAGHDHDRGRPARAQPAPDRRRDPRTRSTATSAAAPATRTSSPRSNTPPRPCGPVRP